MRGIDYQPGGSSANKDPLADASTCQRDIKRFQDLGVNTVRVYTVDNSADHKECMSALADAGIYLVLDVNNSKFALNRVDPGPTYNADYLQNVFATMDEFSKYTNTLAFFSGNEVINDQPGTDISAPYIKALTRDMKMYRSQQKLRNIPIGYSGADVSSNRMQTAAYMNCGGDDVRSDFFAFNDYSWCNTNFVQAGWDQKVKNFTDYGLPIFLSEWGCNTNGARKFDELSALMSNKMTGVYSGGLMYEYSYEESKYGIVDIDGSSVSPRQPEYDNFKNSLKKNSAPTDDGGASSSSHSSDCPAKTAGWNVDPKLIPDVPKEAAKYFSGGAGKGKGLSGDGSMQASSSGVSAGNSSAFDGSKAPTSSDDKANTGVSVYGSMTATAAGLAAMAMLMNAL